ncbi:hypothetical protein [Roseimicrobium sp. ORNL1]|uniref:hypothetical protein n=1 Tax=Roseimicrobium sp. ORNL1 TaxID=2711231 RepID=UPI0013E0EBFE|nr:hypothetical protein [Roseimicrobium sp. ORNL1]QIF02111.1 hypothetical protein G5S37_11390 [Roseimicrobium sp. ORNL1]
MALILSIESVVTHVICSDEKALIILAVGTVTSSGWTRPELSPWVYITPPKDGIYDFSFIATPPSGIVTPSLRPIIGGGVFPNMPSWVKGVRIHASSNCKEAPVSDICLVDFNKLKLAWDGDLPWPDIFRVTDGTIIGNG